ncbi:hypothetical protein U1Q18_021464 [Sarracenia purpurea var. burkii]
MHDKMSSVISFSYPWTTSAYNNVLEAAGNEKHMAYISDHMCREGLEADMKTFCYLIKGYGNAGIFHNVTNTSSFAFLAGELEIAENTSLYNVVILLVQKQRIWQKSRVFKGIKDKQCN